MGMVYISIQQTNRFPICKILDMSCGPPCWIALVRWYPHNGPPIQLTPPNPHFLASNLLTAVLTPLTLTPLTHNPPTYCVHPFCEREHNLICGWFNPMCVLVEPMSGFRYYKQSFLMDVKNACRYRQTFNCSTGQGLAMLVAHLLCTHATCTSTLPPYGLMCLPLGRLLVCLNHECVILCIPVDNNISTHRGLTHHPRHYWYHNSFFDAILVNSNNFILTIVCMYHKSMYCHPIIYR